MSSATKKFALATLTTPVLAALAIGLAGSAAAAPAGPQPSDTGTTTTADPAFTNATNLVTINFPNLPRVDLIGDGVWDSFKLGTAERPAGRTARGATKNKVAADYHSGRSGDVLNSINFSPVRPIGDGVWDGLTRPKLGTAARPADRTAPGATQGKPLLGGFINQRTGSRYESRGTIRISSRTD
jgi:hypothetical protein